MRFLFTVRHHYSAHLPTTYFDCHSPSFYCPLLCISVLFATISVSGDSRAPKSVLSVSRWVFVRVVYFWLKLKSIGMTCYARRSFRGGVDDNGL